MLPPLNLQTWINANRHLLKPPVGNQLIHNGEFMIMVVGGPNSRTDYHVNQGEEFFYQLEGSITLKVIEAGQIKDIVIGPGEIFLLPGGVPHSPRRPADTIGLVIERMRRPDELDGFQWYCECGHKLYEEFLYVSDLVSQLPPVFDRFYGNPAHCSCSQCGQVMTR
jgi:3-hydroxyanthranilate 3,4-dioxygenase